MQPGSVALKLLVNACCELAGAIEGLESAQPGVRQWQQCACHTRAPRCADDGRVAAGQRCGSGWWVCWRACATSCRPSRSAARLRWCGSGACALAALRMVTPSPQPPNVGVRQSSRNPYAAFGGALGAELQEVGACARRPPEPARRVLAVAQLRTLEGKLKNLVVTNTPLKMRCLGSESCAQASAAETRGDALTPAGSSHAARRCPGLADGAAVGDFVPLAVRARVPGRACTLMPTRRVTRAQRPAAAERRPQRLAGQSGLRVGPQEPQGRRGAAQRHWRAPVREAQRPFAQCAARVRASDRAG